MDIFKLQIADYEAKAKLEEEREAKIQQSFIWDSLVGCSGVIPKSSITIPQSSGEIEKIEPSLFKKIFDFLH